MQKLKIVNKLLSEDYPEKFDVELAELAVAGLTMDTQLSDLISPQSYLLFEALGWRKSDVKELVESNFDIRSDIYRKFKGQVKSLQVTNVMAERNIRLIQDFIAKNHSEDKLQDTLQVVKKNRAEYPKNMSKSHFTSM